MQPKEPTAERWLEAVVRTAWARLVAPRTAARGGAAVARAVPLLAAPFGGRATFLEMLARALARAWRAAEPEAPEMDPGEVVALLAHPTSRVAHPFHRFLQARGADLAPALGEVLPADRAEPALAWLDALAPGPDIHADAAELLSRLGRHEEAARRWRAAGRPALARIAEIDAARGRALDGEAEEAALRAAGELARREGDLAARREVLLRRARLAEHRGGPAAARALLDAAVELAEAAGDPAGLARTLEQRSRSSAEAGNVNDAVADLAAGEAALRRLGHAGEATRTLRLAGHLLFEAGRRVEGLAVLLGAHARAARTDPVLTDLLERTIAGLHASLPPEEADALDRRVLDRDPDAVAREVLEAARRRSERATRR